MKPWTILSSKTVIQDKFIHLRTDRCQREDGHIVPAYHVLEFSEWVTVIPLTDEGEIILVKEYRHAAGKVMIGLPGGVSDPGEDNWAEVGARELAEETGYTPREMVKVGAAYANPATQTNQIHYYLALGCEKTGEQNLDGNEQIETLTIPYAHFLDYGDLPVQHALHAAALFYTEAYFGKHPETRPRG